MSFAALEARANAAVMRRLSNARGDFGGEDFPVLFENGYVEFGGITSLRPTAVVEGGQLGACVPNQTTLRINAATSYLVRDVQNDGTGMATLILEAAGA